MEKTSDIVVAAKGQESDIVQRRPIVIAILSVVAIGISGSFLRGGLGVWFTHSGGDMLCTIFWCLLILLCCPKRKYIPQIIAIEILIDSSLEFSQMIQFSWLNWLRTTFIGQLFLGDPFEAWDFAWFLAGAAVAWPLMIYLTIPKQCEQQAV